jgi:hypothetical protein
MRNKLNKNEDRVKGYYWVMHLEWMDQGFIIAYYDGSSWQFPGNELDFYDEDLHMICEATIPLPEELKNKVVLKFFGEQNNTMLNEWIKSYPLDYWVVVYDRIANIRTWLVGWRYVMPDYVADENINELLSKTDLLGYTDQRLGIRIFGVGEVVLDLS